MRAGEGGAPPEHLDVLIVGAGLSGIAAAHHVSTSCRWATYAVVESRGSIGGTWDLFRYPGVRSDSDMFTLGYSFRPWPREESIAEGGDILDYIRATAAEEGIDRHIRFHQRVVAAEWSSSTARWTVTLERTGDGEGSTTGERTTLTCSWLFCCTGYYRYDRGHEIDLPGRDEFRGRIVHPQSWPEDLDFAGKRVVVVGSGATAITLVPAMAPDAAHVTMLQRSPTYVVSLPSRNPITPVLRRVLPQRLQGPALRWTNALATQASYQISRRRPELVKRTLRRRLQRQLPEGYDVGTHFTPRYDPWDQRLCIAADGDLFRVIRQGRASVVTDTIDHLTERGIRLSSGRELEADVIVTATGLELLFLGGMELRVDGEVVDPSDRLTYKGMMLSGVPNLSMAVGYTNASWTLKAELTCSYACRLIDHLHRTGLTTATPVPPNEDPDEEPLLGLTSGYIQRSAHLFPKQGGRYPWRVYQSYLRDYRATRLSRVDDGAMVFTGPRPEVRREDTVRREDAMAGEATA